MSAKADQRKIERARSSWPNAKLSGPPTAARLSDLLGLYLYEDNQCLRK